MTRRLPISAWLSILALAAGAIGCGDDDENDPRGGETARHGLTAEQASQVLAKIGDRTITLGEFADELASKSPYLQARYQSPERRRELLDAMVQFELLAAEARRRGLHKLPEVDAARKTILENLLRQEVTEGVTPSSVTDEEARAYFDAHPEEYNQPAQVRASVISVATRPEAERILGELRGHEDDMALFRRLATEHNLSEDLKRTQGDLRFFSEQPSDGEGPLTPPAEVRRAAFAIADVGRLAPEAVRTANGFFIVKLTGRRPALERTFEQVEAPIRSMLWQKKREAALYTLLAELRRASDVRIDESVLGDVRFDDSPAPPTPEEAARGDDD